MTDLGDTSLIPARQPERNDGVKLQRYKSASFNGEGSERQTEYEQERGRVRGVERPPSPIISLIPQIRV